MALMELGRVTVELPPRLSVREFLSFGRHRRTFDPRAYCFTRPELHRVAVIS